jgi:hypothetical protein
MALITCPDCLRQISDQAPACPQCGRPNRDHARPVCPSPQKIRQMEPVPVKVRTGRLTIIFTLFLLAALAWWIWALFVGADRAFH